MLCGGSVFSSWMSPSLKCDPLAIADLIQLLEVEKRKGAKSILMSTHSAEKILMLLSFFTKGICVLREASPAQLREAFDMPEASLNDIGSDQRRL